MTGNRWRSAKRAPKDGTRILAFDEELKEIVIAWWEDDDWQSVQGPLGRQSFQYWQLLPRPPRASRKKAQAKRSSAKATR